MAILSSDGKSVTVQKGDTLSQIATTYKSTIGSSLTLNERINRLCSLNDIDNPNYIVVGQVIKLTSDASSGSTSSTNNSSTKVTIKAFGLQSNTDRTVYASWTWTKEHTKEYRSVWYYDTGDGVWFLGSDSSDTPKQSVYTAPSNAKRVRFKVKPVSTTHTVNGKETSYWTGDWTAYKDYSFSDNPPTTPPVPTVTIEKYKLIAELDNLDMNGDTIEFQIVKDDSTTFASGKSSIVTSHASYSCTVDAGGEYKVRARAIKGSDTSDWSEYSNNVGTIPSAPASIIYIKALSKTSVQIKWEKVSNATGCEVEYTTNEKYFDSSNAVSSITVYSKEFAEVTGLETGNQYFFRVRAVNDNGESGWSEIVSITLGKAPSAPTTWSNTTTVMVGGTLVLYWVHNTEDGSSQVEAELEINGTVLTIENSTDEDKKDETSSYTVDTTTYTDGTKINWRVRTCGITGEYGDWSVMRTVNIYAPPTLSLIVTNSRGDELNVLTSFPFYVNGTAGPATQTPVGYHLSIISNETYETVDQIGNFKMVGKGEEIYSNYFDTNKKLIVEMSAGNIDLENNISYTVSCTVSMDSGLTAEAEKDFSVSWTDELYEPNAELAIDKDTLAAHIRPYCEDENGSLISGITLSVYRREFDGSFITIATGINNTSNTFVTDPHPALDYARYRIVAISDNTGSVSFYDLPGYPTGETAIIIQWNERWSNFDATESTPLGEPAWSGSMLKLPYNVDVSDSNSKDVELIEYIGREHPVSYYGTQIGSTSTWSVDIDRKDIETLYALRRLSRWMGDVYVREPSGSGYWASVSVSFSQKHLDLVIPVTIAVVRVSGGM